MSTPLMIFAAGFGTRMGALTRDLPKPLLSVAGQSLISRAIALGRDAGCDPIVANTHYLSEKLAPVLDEAGVYRSHEPGPILDTGGGLKKALPTLGRGVVATLNPDAVWLGDNPIRVLLAHGLPNGADAALLLVPAARAHARTGPGDFSLDGTRPVRGGPLIYTGAGLIRSDAVARWPEDVFSLNAVWDEAAAAGRLVAQVYDGAWCDVGHPDGLKEAERLLGSAT
jgi:MurNAc alpha-1-phosphate uridylyltransferase